MIRITVPSLFVTYVIFSLFRSLLQLDLEPKNFQETLEQAVVAIVLTLALVIIADLIKGLRSEKM